MTCSAVVEASVASARTLTRIFAETMAVNVASRATMASVGLTHVRTFHMEVDEPLPGSDLGEVEYAISVEQWRAR